MSKSVTLFTSSSNTLNKAYYQHCKIFFEYFAANGWNLVYGAGNIGIMKTAADVFKTHNRHITGVITEKIHSWDVGYPQICDEYIITQTIEERKELLINRGDLILVCPGGVGTFDELFTFLSLKQLGYTDKKVIIVNSENYFAHFETLFEAMKEKEFIPNPSEKLFFMVSSIDELEKAL